ncbi:MAG: His-Xaa-Ser system radical SAM maturase HxsC [Woeseia sp.]
MIPLKLKADFESKSAPYVVKLLPTESSGADGDGVASVRELSPGILTCTSSNGVFTYYLQGDNEWHGDVVLCIPEAGRVERLFRANSKNNTLLFTERCDQLCVMCSQPPREIDSAWRLPLYEQALGLVEPNSIIGISGGEPTLYKSELLEMLNRLGDQRSDLVFHILTNAQHFSESDRPLLKEVHAKLKVIWGVPLYSASKVEHDLIVGKEGAFDPLIKNLFLLASTNANIELRTVLTGLNALDLPSLSSFVSRHLSFISTWAIMATEPIGFAKANHHRVFFDHSIMPQPICSAIDICEIRGVSVKLFNFPLCTIPGPYRQFCAQSISDWKTKYLKICDSCSQRTSCCGFFEWYNDKWKWQNVEPLGEVG